MTYGRRSRQGHHHLRRHRRDPHAEHVAKIRRILEELGLHIATPDEAREMLKLKGGRNVAF
jgi:uncharacterized protein (DUF849 family)